MQPASTLLRQWIRTVRSDEQGKATIHGRKIYIVPTRYGLLFGVLLGAMLIGALNYSNNPAFLLTFLLTGLFIQTIYSTWYNLLALSIQWTGSSPTFAGTTTWLEFQLSDSHCRSHQAIQLTFGSNDPAITDIPDGKATRIRVAFKTRHRGLIAPGRVTIETRYPFGLARAWSYLESDAEVLVYPQAADNWEQHTPPQYQGTQHGDKGVGTDDFVGHRGYHPGDSPKHINWKAFAAERGLYTKQFGGDRMDTLWLDFEQLATTDTELRLSQLCRAILDLERSGSHYGLRLPNQAIPPATGAEHQRQCLSALALFGHNP